MRIRSINTSKGKYYITNRLVKERRYIRQGAELPDYARYNNLVLVGGKWVRQPA